jgi:phosphate transport system permease protein
VRVTLARRRAGDRIVAAALWALTLVAVVPLIAVLGYVAVQGASAIDWAFFTQLPGPAGEAGGGFVNAIVGTLVLLGLASTVGLPVGVLGGIWLAEYGENRAAFWVRYLADVLNGVPSITIGIVVYGLIVLPMGTFSAYAGGAALGIMMIPMIMRTTEELLRLVPDSLREASLALGIPRWRTTLSVVVRTASGGVITGVLLAMARVAGETAPLIFTAFGNRFWHRGLDEPIASMTLQIFQYATGPFDDWHRQAWAGALVLSGMIFTISLAARFATRQRFGGRT